MGETTPQMWGVHDELTSEIAMRLGKDVGIFSLVCKAFKQVCTQHKSYVLRQALLKASGDRYRAFIRRRALEVMIEPCEVVMDALAHDDITKSQMLGILHDMLNMYFFIKNVERKEAMLDMIYEGARKLTLRARELFVFEISYNPLLTEVFHALLWKRFGLQMVWRTPMLDGASGYYNVLETLTYQYNQHLLWDCPKDKSLALLHACYGYDVESHDMHSLLDAGYRHPYALAALATEGNCTVLESFIAKTKPTNDEMYFAVRKARENNNEEFLKKLYEITGFAKVVREWDGSCD